MNAWKRNTKKFVSSPLSVGAKKQRTEKKTTPFFGKLEQETDY